MRQHPRAKRLQIIYDLAERKESALLKQWGDLQQKLAAEVQQRQQLETYNNEYQQKISAPSSVAIKAGDIHATLQFMQQIKQALVSQQEKLTLLEKQAATAKEAYLIQRGKTQALVKLMDKLDAEHIVEADKQLQKQADEWSNRNASIRMRQRR